MLAGSGAAGRHGGDAGVSGDHAGQVQFVPLPGAVRIDRIHHNLARTKFFRTFGPFEGVQSRAFAKPAHRDFIAAGAPSGIIRTDRVHPHDDILPPEGLGHLGDNRGILDRQRIHRDLFRAGIQDVVHVLDGVKTASDGKRDVNYFADFPHHLDVNGPFLGGGGDIVENQFVGTAAAVRDRQLDRIA